MEGLLLGLITVLLWEFQRMAKRKEKYKNAYWCERKGRTRVGKIVGLKSNCRPGARRVPNIRIALLS